MQIKNDKQYQKAVERKREIEKTSKLAREASKLTAALQIYDNDRAQKSVKTTREEVASGEPELSFTEHTIKNRIELINHLMLVKGREYVRGDDRLWNFRRSATIMQVNMPTALHGFLQKHLTSYYDMIDDINAGKFVSDTVINEKLGDIIIYFLLQEACIKTHMNEKFPPTTLMAPTHASYRIEEIQNDIDLDKAVERYHDLKAKDDFELTKLQISELYAIQTLIEEYTGKPI
jgi:hypothetical protein